MNKRLREYFAKLRAPVLVPRWSSDQKVTEYVRSFATDHDGNKVIVRREITRVVRGPITDQDLLAAWRHLSDEDLLRAIRRVEGKAHHASTYGIRLRVAKLRGLRYEH